MEGDIPKEPVSEEKEAPPPQEVSPPSMMSLPVELLEDDLLPYFNYGDLLRLRRVCKPIQLISERVIRKNFPLLTTPREINQTNFTFQNYLQINLPPTTSIYLNNTSSSIFQDPGLPAFLTLHGPKITHLKVQLFSSCISEPELHFYSSLPNLQVLEIQRIEIPPAPPAPWAYEESNFKFPPNFKNLKTLKFEDIQGGPYRKACEVYANRLIRYCETLEHVKSNGVTSEQIWMYIEDRHEEHPDLPNLRSYDMEHFLPWLEETKSEREFPYPDDPQQRWLQISSSYLDIMHACFDYGVKLINVHSDFNSSYRQGWTGFMTNGETRDMFSTAIVSLVNFGHTTIYGELPFLEKLTIGSTSSSCFGDRAAIIRNLREWENPRWPKLKQVELNIDGLVSSVQYSRIPDEGETVNMLNFLFDCERQAGGIEEVAIRNAEEYRDWREHGQLRQFPWVRKLTTTCPRLTKLTLGNWKGEGDGDMVGFWEGFPLLEEIVLEACELIGDGAFLGGDMAFLKLKKLNKLSLKGLDLMPKITDLAFQNVFQHLAVKQFVLTSEQPVKSITVAGIECLLDGQFNSSVEKFPFEGWSLDGVSPEAFAQLKTRFRASHML